METYANALLYAIPFFIFLLVVEIGYGFYIKNQMHKVMDTVSSISSGLTNIIKDSLGLAFIVVSYPFLLEKHLKGKKLIVLQIFRCIYWKKRMWLQFPVKISELAIALEYLTLLHKSKLLKL